MSDAGSSDPFTPSGSDPAMKQPPDQGAGASPSSGSGGSGTLFGLDFTTPLALFGVGLGGTLLLYALGRMFSSKG